MSGPSDEGRARALIVADNERDCHRSEALFLVVCPICLARDIATLLSDVRAEERERCIEAVQDCGGASCCDYGCCGGHQSEHVAAIRKSRTP